MKEVSGKGLILNTAYESSLLVLLPYIAESTKVCTE